MFDVPGWVNNLIESIIISVIFFVIYVIASFIIRDSIKKLGPHLKDYNRKVTTAKLLNSSLKYIMFIAAFIGILVVCGVQVSAIITGAGLLSIAFGFGAQSIVSDVLSGLFIFFEKQYDVGDTVQIEGFTGEVVSLGFKSTVLKKWTGDIFVIGNGKINSVINYSQANSVAVVNVKVEADSDFDKIQKLVNTSLANIVKEYDYFTENPEYKGINEISSSGMKILITAQTKPMRHFEAERVIRRCLIDIFEKENIKFSYPKIEYKGDANV